VKEKGLLAVMVLLFLMGAMVDFTAAILSRLVDFLFIGGGLAVMWQLAKRQRHENAKLHDENAVLLAEKTQLQRRLDLLAPNVAETKARRA